MKRRTATWSSYDGASNRLDLGGSYTTGNRITNFNSCSYSTDADGNVTSRTCGGQTVRFHWTAENRLKAVKVVGGDSLDFRYDATGRLVRRDVNSSVQAYFLWSGDHLFAELDPNGVDRVEYSYYPGMDRLHAVSAASDTVYFAHQDGLGNTIGLVNHHNNQQRGSYQYDRWGKWVTENENLGSGARNRSRFKGALWMGDQGPELYYMRNRWYEPHSGRFLSEDPIGLAGGINTYVYAGNDPASRKDPSGLAPSCEDDDSRHDAAPCSTRGWGEFGGSYTLGLFDAYGPGGLMRRWEPVLRGRMEFQSALSRALRLVADQVAAGNPGATMFPFIIASSPWLLEGWRQSPTNALCRPRAGNAAGCTGEGWTVVSIERPYQAIAATLIHENAHANGVGLDHHWLAGVAAHLFIQGLSRRDAQIAAAAGSGRIIPPVFRLP